MYLLLIKQPFCLFKNIIINENSNEYTRNEIINTTVKYLYAEIICLRVLARQGKNSQYKEILQLCTQPHVTEPYDEYVIFCQW